MDRIASAALILALAFLLVTTLAFDLFSRQAIAAIITGALFGALLANHRTLIWTLFILACVAWLVVIFTPVALSGMFRPGTPVLDLFIGAGIITIFVVTIVRFGLLATIAALATHFILLRAPLTLQLSSWRAPIALWFLATIAVAGFGAVYLARCGKQSSKVLKF